ncbi:hypothetical protein [Amycolatopsis albispora]|uniref:Uncharacterized protein n=1 Tax=Amycolatopsis albispora TaxID=1804986 RepID=A0A344L2U8_9PSEU|nr:hypothetical protein [Amycolatopsis albispora]AXB42372.1 hypothetical protein A4R43_07385 [Amycolatopsis albispora]
MKALTEGLFDDAAVFPPGSASLPDALTAHFGHRRAWYAGMVGPLVLAESMLDSLGDARPAVALTFPGGPDRVPAVRARAAAMGVRVVAWEIAGALPSGLDGDVYVEIPRDERRLQVLASLAGTPYRAKFRTGGVTADLYPSEAELASSVCAAVRAGVPFKATAGLHHALRNTDPETGFDQHGFLNLLLATDAAVRNGGEERVEALLAERDADVVTARIREWTPERVAIARSWFTSFGTCSIEEPLAELTALGLLGPDRGER